MANEVSRSCKLSVLILGEKKLRFASLIPPSRFHLPASLENIEGIPLFLAADVLAGISQPPKNFARIPARHAKDGLAIKLHLNDVKLDGIKNSHTVWFYSIRGVFQAVFEYQSADVQRNCLLQLRDLWLDRFLDDGLPDEATISCITGSPIMDENLECIFEKCKDSSSKISVRKNTAEEHDFLQLDKSIEPTDILNLSDSSVQDGGGQIPDRMMSRKLYRDLHMDVAESEENGYSLSADPEVISLASVSDLDCNTLTSISAINEETANPSDVELYNPCTTLECIASFLKDLQAHNHTLLNNAVTYSKFLNFLDLLRLDLDSDNHLTPEEMFPWNLFNMYLSIMRNEPLLSQFKNSFNIAPRKNVALCVMSSWLGEEFHKLEDEIAKKATEFKLEYFNCSGNLPASEVIVERLFPLCMRELVGKWMGADDKKQSAFQNSAGLDHCYAFCKEPKRTTSTGVPIKNFYPLIQLILEFANGSLVSGEAHVLYAALQHAS